MFDVGWFTAAAGIWRRGDDLERQVRFPIPSYLIETAEERILVDTGLHPGAAADPARHYDTPDALAMFRLELEAAISEQIDLTTITKVVMTHLHFDHAGALALAAALGSGDRAAPRVGGGPGQGRGGQELLPARRLRHDR